MLTSQSRIVRAGRHLTAGILSVRPDGRAFVFRAVDGRFAILDGSSFANRHAAQRAVDRISQLDQSGAAGPVAA